MSEKIRTFINSLAEKHKYKPLSPGESEYVREKFKRELPSFLADKIEGSDMNLFTKRQGSDGELVCKGFDRIVIGDYGAFVEFSESQIPSEGFVVIKGQEWRSEEKYKNTKYDALTTRSFRMLTLKDGAPLIYKQKRLVPYADYVIGKYYIGVYDVFPEMFADGYAESDIVRVQCIERRPFYDSVWEVKDKGDSGEYIPSVRVKRLDSQKASDLLPQAEKRIIEGIWNFEELSDNNVYYD